MNGILKHVILNRVGRKADSSLNINFVTSIEQDSNHLKELDELVKQSGVLYFAPNENAINEDVIKELDNAKLDMPKQKSPSKRLMNVLYVYAKQNGYENGFPEFYENEMAKIISHYKDKLE
jgi:hypothetical protein